MQAHHLVRAEWPWIKDVIPYDFQIDGDDVHIGVYVRRVSGKDWHALAGLVNHVVVAPYARGQGIGRAAVVEARRWLIRMGVPFALLHCDEGHCGFYYRVGFYLAPNFPAPSHRGTRFSLVSQLTDREWPVLPVEYVEPW